MLTGRMVILTIVFAAGLAWMAGCTETPTSDAGDPTTRALSDPMGYTPNHDNEDITGGGFTDFDSDAFKKDMDRVLNP